MVLLGSAGILSGCKTESVLSYIDCHSHLWPEFGVYPFREEIKEDDLKPSSFLAEDLIAAGAPFGFQRFVLIQHIFYHGYDYSYLKSVGEKYPGTFAVVGALNKKIHKLNKKLRKMQVLWLVGTAYLQEMVRLGFWGLIWTGSGSWQLIMIRPSVFCETEMYR